jgi:hypothetical protein
MKTAKKEYQNLVNEGVEITLDEFLKMVGLK